MMATIPCPTCNGEGVVQTWDGKAVATIIDARAAPGPSQERQE